MTTEHAPTPEMPEEGSQSGAEWCCLEIMGHRRHYGRVQEVSRFGVILIQVDVPTEAPDVFTRHTYHPSALFGIKTLTEADARKMAEHDQPRVYTPRSLEFIGFDPAAEEEDTGEVDLFADIEPEISQAEGQFATAEKGTGE